MEPYKSILLHSKYSPKSVEIISHIRNVPFDLEQVLGYSLISIDNKIIRKTLLSSKSISVKEVPCLLKLYRNGTVEQYNYFELKEIISQEINRYNEQVTMVENQSVQQKMQAEYELSESDSDSSIEIIKKSKKSKKNKKHKKKKKEKKEKKEEEQVATQINLSSDEETGSDTDIEQRVNIQNMTVSQHGQDKPPLNANQKKANSLMEAAMQMQKDRENAVDDKNTSKQEMMKNLLESRRGPT